MGASIRIMPRRGVMRLGLLIPMVGGLLAVSGCEGFGAIASAIQGSEKVSKLFELPPQRTLVLVDALPEDGDRDNILDAQPMRSLIASDVTYLLEQNEALGPDLLVPAAELNRVTAELGDDFATTPIDAIARQAGARQVIHILVEGASMRSAGMLLRPIATGQVKVIDVEEGKRLFPTVAALSEGGGVAGYAFSVALDPVSNAQGTRTTFDVYTRKLAREVALNTGQLFYDWKKPDMGSKIK